jgi:CBS domain-containing protein
MRTVKDILNSKAKVDNVVKSNMLVIDALAMLDAVNLSYLVVMDGDDYKGIFSERDYSRNVILKGRTSGSTTVGEIMTTDLPQVALTDSVEYCMNFMNTHKSRYLVTYENNKFAGIVTIHDLLRQVINNKEEVFDQSAASTLLDNDEGGRIY